MFLTWINNLSSRPDLQMDDFSFGFLTLTAPGAVND